MYFDQLLSDEMETMGNKHAKLEPGTRCIIAICSKSCLVSLNILQLPEDMLRLIFRKMQIDHWLNVQLTCKRFLATGRQVFNPLTDINESFEWACKWQRVAAAERWMKEIHLNPAQNGNRPIKLACSTGNTELVQLLLTDERVDPSADNNEAIKLASENGHLDVVCFLLNHHTIRNSRCGEYGVHLASKNGHLGIVQV
jgi:hypothetical protein